VEGDVDEVDKPCREQHNCSVILLQKEKILLNPRKKKKLVFRTQWREILAR
jgi:hypothetical protein